MGIGFPLRIRIPLESYGNETNIEPIAGMGMGRDLDGNMNNPITYHTVTLTKYS